MNSKSHVADWDPDPPTPAQLKELFCQIESGRITKKSLQGFLKGKTKKLVFSLTKEEQAAADILGGEKIAGYHSVCNHWGINISHIKPVVPFSESVLKQRAEENKNGADWRLVYIHGFSLDKQEELIGRNSKKQPCFSPLILWVFKCYSEYIKQVINTGYQLLDFAGRFGNLTWSEEKRKMKQNKLGRAKELAVMEACFSFYFLSGGKERLLQNWWHSGEIKIPDNRRLRVGFFNDQGMSIGIRSHDEFDRLIKVVVCQK